ncbi:MAG: MarR family winged helix-turn-helix transcriptional regulator [Bacteroidales bacterium]|nr:MarR family winged helix-turn-helix transcriptional regulator [Bacteroidales bacterium]MCF8337319.1 MarR family winged helix-turn-helix transcriptional regulator [Bacteroidales bacterium]
MQDEEPKSIGRLISILHRQSRVYFHRQLEPYGLGHGQMPVLMFIIHNEGVTQHEVSRHFQMDKGSTSSLIKSLEENGFIRKETKPDDKRSHGLYITERTKKLHPEFKTIFRGLTEILTQDFTNEEKEKAFELLNRMIGNLKQYTIDEGGHS